MRRPTRRGHPILARTLLRRLPRRQREVIETVRVLGEHRGLSVYLVGGPVRDLVLGCPGADLDLAVTGDAIPFAEALALHLGARATTHPRFGTASLVLQDGMRVDLATARRERYAHPAALPQVVPGTMAADLFRRDFSINAMAVPLVPRGGELLDPFHGLKDLKGGLLRALHEASYRDDPTRIFRGARYAARYRLRFSPRDRRWIRKVLAAGVLGRLSGDRLFRELKLLLSEPAPEAALKILEDLGVLRALDPALTLGRRTVDQMRTVRRRWRRYPHEEGPSRPELWRLGLLVLLRSVRAGLRRRAGGHLGLRAHLLEGFIAELKELPRLERKLMAQRLGAIRLRRLLDRVSPEVCLLLGALAARRARRRVEHYLTRLAAVRPALGGQDLKKLGLRPGPIYRRILDRLLEERLRGRLKSRDDEIAFLRRRFGRPP